MHGIDTGDGDSDPMDVIGHGTRVAGIIGARGNNEQGGTGMNWSVQMIALKVTTQPDGAATTASLLEAHEYLLTLKRRGVNIRVTNNSVGGPSASQAYLEILNACGEAGILNVCAAGNTSTDTDAFPMYPGCYDSDFIVNTASSDSMDQLVQTSNYGATTVDLTAPGLNLHTVDLTGYLSTFSGTSAAAATVTGAIALMSAAAPAQSALSLRHTLLRSADPVPELTNKVASGGRLNVAKAIQNLEEAPALVVTRTMDGNVELQWPAWAVDFTLQHAARPDAGADWREVDRTPTLQTGHYTLTVNSDETEIYFRLQQGPPLDSRHTSPDP
jgi:subtilisin family serine protease